MGVGDLIFLFFLQADAGRREVISAHFQSTSIPSIVHLSFQNKLAIVTGMMSSLLGELDGKDFPAGSTFLVRKVSVIQLNLPGL